MKFTDFINSQTAVESFDKRKLIVFKEKSRVYRAENTNNKAVLKLHIDNKLIKSNERKCDFSAIIPPDSEQPYFIKSKCGNFDEVENDKFDKDTLKQIYSESICFLIETKGRDISIAAEQIQNTIPEITKLFGIKKFVGRIVCSKCKTQELYTTQYNILLRKLKKIKAEYNIPYAPLLQNSDEMNDKI